MSQVVQVGDIYINQEKLSGVSDVQATEVPGGGATLSYNFTIFLEGSEASVFYTDARQAKLDHNTLTEQIPPRLLFSGGGCDLNISYVNAIGAVISEMARSEGEHPFGFQVQMDGAAVNLQYPDQRQAQAARDELVAQMQANRVP